jgi:hypothetical protein
MVGAAAFGAAGLVEPVVLISAGGATLYVAAVTVLASSETQRKSVRGKVLLVVLTAAGWLVGLIYFVQPARFESRWAMTALAIATMIWLTSCLARLGGEQPQPAAVQRTIGGLLRGLILVQATAVVSTSWTGLYVATGLAGCFFVNAVLGRRFYAS